MTARSARLTAVFALALALRLGFALTRPVRPAFADAEQYDAVARNLLARQGFMDSFGRRASRAPGYPLFLAACYGVFGPDPRVARVAQCVIGAAACLLVYHLARRSFDGRTGELAAWLAAAYPFLIAYSGFILSETLFTALLLAGVLLLDAAWLRTVDPQTDEPRRAWLAAAAAGLAFGLAIQVRSSLLLLPLFCLPFWLAAARRRVRALGLWAVVLLVAAMVQAPWVVRNRRVFGRFVPTTLMVGESLLEANGPGADGGPRIDRMREVRDPEINRLSEYERNQRLRDLAVRWIREHPGAFVLLAFEKQRRFWNVVPNATGYRTPLICTASVLAYGPVMALALVGLVAARAEWRRRVLLVVPVLYYSGLHTVFVGSTRYRTPVMPFLMAFSAWGSWVLWRRVRERRPRQDAARPSPGTDP